MSARVFVILLVRKREAVRTAEDATKCGFAVGLGDDYVRYSECLLAFTFVAM